MASGTAVALVDSLSSLLPARAVFTDDATLDTYTADTYWKAIAALAAGSPLGRPDIVVKPTTDSEVAAVLRLANQHHVAVVPWGGGSGTQGASIPVRGGIVIDLTRMNRIIEIDERSLTVTAEAGLNGKELETELNRRGLMLPHYPASVDQATVGGYVAARGSGVLSTRYGKIEDLILSLRVVTPTGEIVDTLPLPRHSVGPDIGQLYVGSEGTMGVITRVRLQLVRLPESRCFDMVSFATLESAVEAVRMGIQLGLRPSVVRVYDEVATRVTLSPVVGQKLPGVSTVMCFEGPKRIVDAEREAMLELARAHGCHVLDRDLGQTWWDHRYDFYGPPHAPVLPAVWGTIDVVAPYTRLMETYQALQATVAKPYAAQGLVLRTHLSHWYLWGAMIYSRFVLPDGGTNAIALHDQIWEDGVKAALGAGAVMNDHHGVGLKLAPYMQWQHGAGLDVLRRVQKAMDPNGVMNPGKLGL